MLEFIGQGSYAAVFRGKWRNAVVAIKKATIADEADAVSLREQLALYVKAGNHPHILPLIGASTTQPAFFLIVCKYCERSSLYQYLLIQQNALSDEQLQDVLMHSSTALGHLHSLRIIHRDVTSRNYLLALPFRIYLADFGISRILSKKRSASSTISDIGPIRWLSPESLFSSVYSPKTDAYMYANFVYEVLFRKVPFFELSNVFDVSDAIRQGIRPTILFELPEVFQNFFQVNWSTNPDDRHDLPAIIEAFSTFFHTFPTFFSSLSTSVLTPTHSNHYDKIVDLK